jgi:ribonucleotide reductase alpha subunit
MEIVQQVQSRKFELRPSFLESYYRKGDPFTSLLARSTYLNKYCRDGETWTDTIKRVVEGNVAYDTNVAASEAELLYHLCWTGQILPPGRGLWTGGIEGIPADARYNCWAVTLRCIDDWCWAMNQLMLGGGVGVNLTAIETMPIVLQGSALLSVRCRSDHQDAQEVGPDANAALNGQTPIYDVPDTREGWVESLRKVLTSAFEGRDLVIDLSGIRPRGMPIKTFGGVACGPGPLAHLLRSSHGIVRQAVGRKLGSVEALDVTNFIAFCVKSGNVRRSAVLTLGHANDQAFRDAKKDWEAVKSHRHTSNNSILFDTDEQIAKFDWDGLVEDVALFGEPGIFNRGLTRKTDPEVECINPCFAGDTKIAVADGRNAVSIQQLAEEGKDVPVYSMDKSTGKIEIKMGRHPRITGYLQKLLRVWLDDGSYLDTTPEHKFLHQDGTCILAKDLTKGTSLPRFTKTVESVKPGSKDYYLVHCDTRDPVKGRVYEHRLIAQFYYADVWANLYKKCQKNGFANTGGIVVHHKDYDQLNNAPGNLQVMSFRDHTLLHNGLDQGGEKNGRWSGVPSEVLRETALKFTASLGRRFSRKEWQAFAREQGLPQQFSRYRVKDLGTLTSLAKQCAAELGYEHADEDPRVVKTYRSMLEQGYEARIFEGKVLVTKTCELCDISFEVIHVHRENAFCSVRCGHLHNMNDSGVRENIRAGMKVLHSDRMPKVRLEQARVCSKLMFQLGRDPIRKEWSLACAKESVTSRIGPTLTYGFKQFREVLAAGNDYNHKVVRVEPLPGEHTVYNITVDDYHTVAVMTSIGAKRGCNTYTGVYVGNCGEMPLFDREACNLAEVFPAKFESGTDQELAFKLTTRYSLRQRLLPLSDPTSDAVRRRNMRIGVAIGGICDFDCTPEKLDAWYKVCRKEANDYADELGVAHPKTVTTTKPSGTISLLSGSSPGMHAPHAPFNIRRVRVPQNDPMSVALADAGVPWDFDVYDSSGRTLVFSFPQRALNPKVTAQTQTVRDQFERQLLLQEHWSDSAVSATISFRADEKDELTRCLKEFVPRLKSTSCLPAAHGYEQPPYSECSEEEYWTLYQQINHSHPLVRGGDFEIEECSSGACPVK